LPLLTRDNVSVQVSGNLYTLFTNPERAAYGNSNPLYAVRQHAQSSMRASIGELELDEILHARARLNAMVKSSVQEAAQAWGMEVIAS
jgi:regulator of protease activity HflC (stomatin/prohibitin superfamily)